jgi:hypothetical protein
VTLGRAQNDPAADTASKGGIERTVYRRTATLLYLVSSGTIRTVNVDPSDLAAALVRDRANGMAEAFVRTLKRDYVRVSARPDARTVINQLPIRIDHYNRVHPHRALGYS